jgi:hypothetical protein
MVTDTERFVVEANIKRYREILETARDPKWREVVQELLADAEKNLRSMEHADKHASGSHSVATFLTLAMTLAQAA